MDRSQAFDGLQLHENTVVNQQISQEADVETQIIVPDSNRNFALNVEISLGELVCQDGLIDRFLQARPEGRFTLNAASTTSRAISFSGMLILPPLCAFAALRETTYGASLTNRGCDGSCGYRLSSK